MKVKFWGSRGSIPVPDRRMIKYGGNTTSLEVILNNRILIIDSGTGIRKLGEELMRREIFDMDIFLTHSHWDHIQGFPFFSPIYSERTRINIFGRSSSYKPLKDILSHQMSYEYFPVSFSDLKSTINFLGASGNQFEIDNHRIKLIQTNHPVFTTGLRIEKDNKSFVFITDNELLCEEAKTSMDEFVKFCHQADYLIHDAQFTEEEYKKRKGWGHSTFKQAIMLAHHSEVKRLGFFHHDPNRKDGELEKIVQKSERLCREKGYRFTIFAVREITQIEL